MFYKTKDSEIDVLIFVEHKDRELEIACAIGHILETAGMCIAIASSIYDPMKSLLFIKPKVIVTPFTGFGKGSVAELFYSVYGNTIKYINLNYEQFISSWKGSYKTSRHPFSKDHQIQLVWGEYFKNELIKHGVCGENIHITGRPSLSLIKSKYQNCNRREFVDSYPKHENKKICFIALTDGLAFLGDKKIDFIVENGGDRAGLEAHVEYVKKNINSLFKDIIIEANKNTDVLFVMRPHPSLSEQLYIDLFDRLKLEVPKNVLISKDKNAFWWLAQCEWYVTNYSTLCLEAKVLSKKSFLYEKHKSTNVENYWYTNTASKIDKLESVFLKTEGVAVTNSSFEEKSYINFEKNGLVETAEIISQYTKGVEPKINNQPLTVLIKNSRRSLGSILRNIYVRIGFVPYGKVSKGLFKDHFDSSDVTNYKRTFTDGF